MGKLQFNVRKKIGNARVGEIKLNGVDVQTPIFMPVGTKATIKGMVLDMLKDPKYIGDIEPIRVILANTFHLYLRPGAELVRDAKGLHTFENRDGLILTDSGGFQVFSLGLGKQNNQGKGFAHDIKMKLKEEGVYFRSPYDGSKHIFTPENVVDTQIALGSDIMMMLDVCSPSDANKETIARQMHMTHRWARRAYDHFMPQYDNARGVLFPIVQGGIFHDLRKESVETLSPLATDGIAVGGVSVGEEKSLIQDIVAYTGPMLPEDNPRYLMGVGTPEDLRHAIEHGFDMFDCVLATRLGRHGVFFSDEGNQKITHARHARDFSRLTDNCPCYACQDFSRAYFHHLIREKEMLGGILLGLHNIVYLHRLLIAWKKEMMEG